MTTDHRETDTENSSSSGHFLLLQLLNLDPWLVTVPSFFLLFKGIYAAN